MSQDLVLTPKVEEEQSSIPGVQIFNITYPEAAQAFGPSSIKQPVARDVFADGSDTIMLNAAAMKDLLSENVDENASHFAFFSRYGTMMGHDHAADVKAVMRFTAFAANTWGRSDAAVKETGQVVEPLTPGTTILQAIVKEDGSGLHCLIMQVNDLVGAVTHVREGTLLAALKRKEEFAGERVEIAARIKGVKGPDEAEVSQGAGGGGGGGGGVTTAAAEGEDVAKGEGSGGEDGGKEKGKGKEQEKEVEEEGEGEGEGEEKPTKMQILVWRSEGMGQYMADELGPNFKIPKGFY